VVAVAPLIRRMSMIIVVAAVVVAVFFVGRSSVLPRGVEIRRSEYPGWIEIHRAGELSAEFHQEKDAEVWLWLDWILRDADELYGPPAPGAPPRGHGPARQQQVSRRPL